MNITDTLLSWREEEYAAFTAKLVPNITPESIIGVRVPHIRKLAREVQGTPEADAFLHELPHTYHEENMLHACLIDRMRDYAAAMDTIEAFLPHVTNWAVCDTLKPRVKDRADYLARAKVWIASDHTYTCRHGIDALMTEFLDEHFDPALPDLVAGVRSEEYYVRMMVAWYFATALAKQWDSVIPYLTGHRLDEWTHRKTIQKAVESFRITPEQKEYLRSLR